MPLLELWRSNPDAVSRLTIQQLVSAAGDGILRDHGECSHELCEYLSYIPCCRLKDHMNHCLSTSFTNSGLVLQDLVNEFGRRLGFHVDNGLYRGRPDAVGFDGLWRAPEDQDLVVEVKTTDAFRLNLDVIAGYKNALCGQGRVSPRSSLLIVVGRQDTGEIEDQIRGSRHAWDARLISTEALAALVALKEEARPREAARIRGLLKPFDTTRIDNIIEAMVATGNKCTPTAHDGERRAAITRIRQRIAVAGIKRSRL